VGKGRNVGAPGRGRGPNGARSQRQPELADFVEIHDGRVRACARLSLLIRSPVPPDCTSFRDQYKGCNRSAHCASQPPMALREISTPWLFEDLFLPMQRQVIDALGYDHLRRQAGPGRALFDRLRRLGCRLNGASASVFLAHILDDGQLRRNVFVALAGFFTERVIEHQMKW
jgi:hypothetical protein